MQHHICSTRIPFEPPMQGVGLHVHSYGMHTCNTLDGRFMIKGNSCATNVMLHSYCILRGWIKGFNHSITTIMCEDGSYRTVVG